MTRPKLFIAFLIFLYCSPLATSQTIQFTDLENLPAARSALTSANDGENIYIVNGFGIDEQYTDEVFKYNIAQSTWSTLTSSTIPKRFASAAVVGGFLYVFNGITQNGVLNNSVEKISLADGTIELMSENPQPCEAAGVTTWSNKIYSFGGSLSPNTTSNKLYEFDPENDTWTELTDIPFAGETKGEVVNGKLCIIGGYNGTVSNQIDIYNLSTNMWESSLMMPIGISAHSTAIVGSKIYMVGDFSNLTFVAYFDTFDNSFQILTNNLIARRHCAAEGVGGVLYAIGGNTSSTIQSSIASVQKADILTSINEIDQVESMVIFPNPSEDHLNFNMEFEALKIYDLNGILVKEFFNVNLVGIEDLNSGFYYVSGMKNEVLFKGKFIKK